MSSRMLFLCILIIGILVIVLGTNAKAPGSGKGAVKKIYKPIFLIMGIILTAIGAYGFFTSFVGSVGL